MSGKIAKLIHQEKRLKLKVKKAFAGGQDLHSPTRTYLKSYAARYVAAVDALQGLRKPQSVEAVQTFAREMDAWAPCDEPVRLNPVLKSSYTDCQESSYRYLLSFGVKNRARQILVRNLLLARWETQPAQSQFRGGREQAIKQVKSAYLKGHRYVFEMDVHHCFKSFDRKGIAEYLSLPERVVTGILSGDELNISLSPNWVDEVDNACLGYTDLPDSDLPLFSGPLVSRACSPLVCHHSAA